MRASAPCGGRAGDDLLAVPAGSAATGHVPFAFASAKRKWFGPVSMSAGRVAKPAGSAATGRVLFVLASAQRKWLGPVPMPAEWVAEAADDFGREGAPGGRSDRSRCQSPSQLAASRAPRARKKSRSRGAGVAFAEGGPGVPGAGPPPAAAVVAAGPLTTC